MEQIVFSFAKSIKCSYLSYKPLSEIFNDIKQGKYKNSIEALRKLKNKDEKRVFKNKNLPYFIPAKFKNNIRKNANFISTKYLIFDLDKLPFCHLYKVKKILKKDNFILCFFTSPSGNGLKIIIELEEFIINEADYKSTYIHYKEYFQNKIKIELDNTIDPARCCFISYDKDLYLNTENKKVKIIKNNKSQEIDKKEIVKINKFNNKNNNLYDNCAKFDDTEKIIDFLSGNINNYTDWIKCAFALASLGERGRAPFLRLSENLNYKEDTPEKLNKEFDNFLRNYRSDGITINSLFHIAKIYGYDLKNKSHFEFWEIGKKSGKIEISEKDFLKFLENSGFGKLTGKKSNTFVRIKENIIEETSITEIKDFVLDYLNNISKKTAKLNNLIDKLLSNHKKFFTHGFLEFINPIKLDFKKDSRDFAYFYFLNGCIEVDKDKIEFRDYSDLKGLIWKNQIIKHNIIPENYSICDFEKFISNICKNDEIRIKLMKSVIGYLLHNYKDSANAKAVIFCDEEHSELANGRRGKSLIGLALSKLRNSSRTDGKNFSFEDRFLFQQVNLDTQIFEFNDVVKKFNIEHLNSIITDNMTINRKNRDAFILPFSESPKILISSNFSVPDADDSTKDRIIEVPFSNYYNINHKPEHDFKKRFFDDWNETEWNIFYTFMLNCCQFYLKNGLIKFESNDLKIKKIIQECGEEFYDYFEKIEKDKEYNKKELYEQFIKENPSEYHIKQNTFTKKIKIYSKLMGFNFHETRSNGKQFIKIHNE